MAWPRGAAFFVAGLRLAGRVEVLRLADERAEVDGRVAMFLTVRDDPSGHTRHTRHTGRFLTLSASPERVM